MDHDISVQPLSRSHPELLARAFAPLGWPGKDLASFVDYLRSQDQGAARFWIAECDGDLAGYVGLEKVSAYHPFAESGIREIFDLNVLPQYRRRGIAATLMAAAEAHAARTGTVVGLGVGVVADYAAAFRLYLARGYLPDGQGIAYGRTPVTYGQTVTLDDDAALMMTKPVRS